MTTVLDTSALLAIIKDEPGIDRVQAAFPDVTMSSVNHAEVVTKLTERILAFDAIDAILSSFDIAIVDFDRAQARAAGFLRPATRSAGLSLGDRACLALARTLDAPVLTADRAWAGLDVGVEIEVVR
jgi:PIN domain nuclease of toxin-antitoxin system